MPKHFEMIRVDPADIDLDDPLPYSVFTEDGTLLALRGTRIEDPKQIIALLLKGWRRIRRIAPVIRDTPEPVAVAPSALDRLASIHPVPLAQTTVLVADDMLTARTMLAQILINAGAERILAVEDGQQAITRFIHTAPNLVLLDIDMPKLDGLAALKQIRSWSPGVFACLVSANSSLVNVQTARESAVDGFVVKPYTPLNIDRILKRYLARVPESPAA